MHAELQAVFDEHERPTHASKKAVHEQLGAILRLAGLAQQQVIVYRSLIAQAEVAPHDHALDSKMEMMHQTFGAYEREAAILATCARNLAQVATQLDRYVTEWRSDIAAYEALPPSTPIAQ